MSRLPDILYGIWGGSSLRGKNGSNGVSYTEQTMYTGTPNTKQPLCPVYGVWYLPDVRCTVLLAYVDIADVDTLVYVDIYHVDF